MVWNRVRIWRTGWHTPTKNSREYSPGTSKTGTIIVTVSANLLSLSYMVLGWYSWWKDHRLRPCFVCYWALTRAFEQLSCAAYSWITSFISGPFIWHLFIRMCNSFHTCCQQGGTTYFCFASNPLSPWGGGGDWTKFYTGFRPKDQTFTLLYTISCKKRYPFCISSIDKLYPFHIPSLELYFLIICCKIVFLTVQYNRTDRNSYFGSMDQRTGSARRNCEIAFLRYIWLFVANLNKSSSVLIWTPDFYFICQFCHYLFVAIWQSLVSVYPENVGTTADFSRQGYTFLFSTKWKCLHVVALEFFFFVIVLTLLGLFIDWNDIFSYPFLYTWTSEIPTFSFTWNLKKVPLSCAVSLYRPLQKVPPRPLNCLIKTTVTSANSTDS